jgi:hypothetical protein
VAEVPLGVFEVLVGGDHAGRVQFGGGDGGAQHVEPVKRGRPSYGPFGQRSPTVTRRRIPRVAFCGGYRRSSRAPQAGQIRASQINA